MKILRLFLAVAVLFHFLHESAPCQGLVDSGARPLGMGGTFVSIANDANAVFWNPAGLTSLDRGEVNFMNAKLHGIGISNINLQLVNPITGATAIGFGFNRIGFDDEEIDFGQNVFIGSFGQELLSFLQIGGSVKFVDTAFGLKDGVFSENATGFGFDAGLLLVSPFTTTPFLSDLQLALVIRDISDTNVSFDSGAEDAIFPADYRYGVAWLPKRRGFIGSSSIEPGIAAEISHNNRIHFGGELWINNVQDGLQFWDRLGVRAGIHKDQKGDEGLTYALGASLRWSFLQFDYAHTAPPSLPGTNRFALSLTFAPEPFFTKSKIRLIEISPEKPEIFPSLVEHYERKSRTGIATVALRNPRNERIEGELVVRAEGDLYKARSISLSIAPKDTVYVPIRPLFVKDSVQVAQAEVVPFSVTYRYRYKKGLQDSVTFKGDLEQFDRNTIIWNDFRKAAAFITPGNETVEKFVRSLLQKSEMEWQHDNLEAALWLFEALKVKGVRFGPDRISQNWIRRPSGDIYPDDTIQFPSQLLLGEEKIGDCDDLTVLYCSLLGQLGIETALIDAPKHIFMMFDSQVSSANQLLFPIDPDYLIPYEGRLWIPVEITDVVHDFFEAWTNGQQYYHDLRRRQGAVNIVRTREAWELYPPTQFSSKISGVGFTEQEIGAIRNQVQAEKEKIRKTSEHYITKRYGEEIEEITDSQLLNERAIIHVSEGEEGFEKAKWAFRQILSKSPNHPMALNNLGNLLLLSGNADSLDVAESYYRSAISASDTVLAIRLNLAYLYFQRALDFPQNSDARRNELSKASDELSLLVADPNAARRARTLLNVVSGSGGELQRGETGEEEESVLDMFRGFFRNLFSSKEREDVIWPVYPGRGLTPHDSIEITVEIEVPTAEANPLFGELKAVGTRTSDRIPETVLMNVPSRNLRLTITAVDSSHVYDYPRRERFKIVLANFSSNETLEDVRIRFRLPLGSSHKFSNIPPQKADSDSEFIPVDALTRSGIEPPVVRLANYLFWYR